MKSPCKIRVVSTRRYSATRLLPPLSQREEEWEEDPELFDEPEDVDEEESPFVTTTLTAWGLFGKEEDGSFRLSYEDSEITGLEGCLSTFCLSATGMLILLRQGQIRTCMVFEEGHRHLCDYGAEQELPSVTLHTHELFSDLSERGGVIRVCYSVEIRGTRTEQNELEIEVELT